MVKLEKTLDWEIAQNPIYNLNNNIIPGYKEIRKVGASTNQLLSVMKTSYYPIKIESFKKIIDTISRETDMELAGYNEFRNGKVITAQLKSNNPFLIGGSTIEGYLTIGTGFDGSQSFFIGHTSEYLRCANQFGRIIKNYVSRLTKSNTQRIDQILSELIHYNHYEKELYSSFERMTKIKVDSKITRDCIERLVGLSQEEKLDNSLITKSTGIKLVTLRDSILREYKDLGENAFGLFNGITHYTTHKMETRTPDVFGNILTSKAKINNMGYELITKELVV